MILMDFNNAKVEIYGFHGEIDSVDSVLKKFNTFKTDPNIIIQLMDSDAIAGKNHVLHAVNQAFLAFKRGENLAKNIDVEICLRSSAQRQISKAFNILGLKKGKMNLCAVLINCPDSVFDELNDMFTLDNDVLSPDYSKLKEIYNINDEELSNIYIEDILIDRISHLIVDY